MTALSCARILPATLALLFAWAYGFWLPLHLTVEPHHGSLGPAAHAHAHGHGHAHPHGQHGQHGHGHGHHGHHGHGGPQHEHPEPAGEPADGESSLHPVEHEHPAHAHEHPSLRTATKTPYVTVFMQTIGIDIKTPEVTARFVRTPCHDPPKLHAHYQASPRAPPRSTFSPSVCG